MGKGSGGAPQVDFNALIDAQKQANRINQITPFGSVFYGQYGTSSTGTPAPTPTGGTVPQQNFPWLVNYNAGVSPGNANVPANAAQLLAQQQQTAQPGSTFTPTNIPGQPEGFQASSPDTQVVQYSPEVQALYNSQIGTAGALSNAAAQQAGNLPTGAFNYDPTAARTAAEQAIFQRAKGLLDPVFARQEESLRDTLANTGQLGTRFVNPGARQELDIFNTNRGNTYENAALDAIIRSEGVASSELQRALAARAVPYNELSALLQGSQINVPGLNTNIPGVDVLGPAQMQQNSQMAAYQNKQANQQALMGGLFGLGSAAILASDRRVKKNIERVGKTDDGLPVYTYQYKWGGPTHMGVMAQDVEKKNPDAVVNVGGMLAVDYGAL